MISSSGVFNRLHINIAVNHMKYINTLRGPDIGNAAFPFRGEMISYSGEIFVLRKGQLVP